MRKLSLFLAIILLCNHSYAAVSATNGTVDRSKNTAVPAVASLPLNQNMKIKSATAHEENTDLFYVIDAEYPQIDGENLSPAAMRFNKFINESITQTELQFINYVKADIPHMQTLPDSVKHNTLKIDFQLDIINDKNILSVRIMSEGMQAGRAHPYHTYQTFNYDLTQGKILTLNDIFKPKVKYLTVLAKYASVELNKKLQDKWMIKEGTAPVLKNYQNWNLKKNSILITFNEYQVAPYYAGSPEVQIPYAKLKNIIAPSSPIALCLKDAC